jgi:hypothetical protein
MSPEVEINRSYQILSQIPISRGKACLLYKPLLLQTSYYAIVDKEKITEEKNQKLCNSIYKTSLRQDIKEKKERQHIHQWKTLKCRLSPDLCGNLVSVLFLCSSLHNLKTFF